MCSTPEIHSRSGYTVQACRSDLTIAQTALQSVVLSLYFRCMRAVAVVGVCKSRELLPNDATGICKIRHPLLNL